MATLAALSFSILGLLVFLTILLLLAAVIGVVVFFAVKLTKRE